MFVDFFVVSRQELNAVIHTAVLDLAFSECFVVMFVFRQGSTSRVAHSD